MGIDVQCMDHVTIVSRNLENTRRFYVDVLGMRQVARPPFTFPGLWFQAGDTLIHVNVTGEEAGPAGQPFPAGTIPSRGLHIAFRVWDVNAAADLLLAEGLKIVSGPRARPDGAMQVYVHDPDGYLIELCSDPPVT